MAPTDLEQLRLSLLRHLATNPTRWGLTAALLTQYVRAEGLDVDATRVKCELLYLEDRGLVALVDKSISPEVRAWRVTASGRDLHAQSHHG